MAKQKEKLMLEPGLVSIVFVPVLTSVADR
jgi:hypothetical protein